jgi:hypothetical protein
MTLKEGDPMGRWICLITTLVFLCGSSLSARTWYIEPDGTGEAPTISAGNDSAASGDTLLLADGTYIGPGNRNVLVFNKRLTFMSESGNPEACVIDCQGAGEDCIIYSGWDMGVPPYPPATGTVRGIKITGARSGVVAAVEASAWIINCIISGNAEAGLNAIGVPAQGYGYVHADSCVFSSNSADAVLCDYKCSAGIVACVFYSNGRALRMDEQGSASLTGCTIAANSGSGGGVILGGVTSLVSVTECIIAFNSGNSVDCQSGTVLVECCDIYSNGGDYVSCIAGLNGIDGNFSADPKFCDLAGRDFGLDADSPCLPGNHPDGSACGLIGALPQGCGSHAVQPQTWGGIKSLYR